MIYVILEVSPLSLENWKNKNNTQQTHEPKQQMLLCDIHRVADASVKRDQAQEHPLRGIGGRRKRRSFLGAEKPSEIGRNPADQAATMETQIIPRSLQFQAAALPGLLPLLSEALRPSRLGERADSRGVGNGPNVHGNLEFFHFLYMFN